MRWKDAKKGPKNLMGLKASHFRRPLRWKIDQDYIHKLSTEEKEWLAKFNREWVGNEFNADTGLHKTQKQKLENYGNQDAIRRDIMAVGYKEPLTEHNEPQLSGTRAEDIAEIKKHLKSKRLRRLLHKVPKQVLKGRRPTDNALQQHNKKQVPATDDVGPLNKKKRRGVEG